MTPALRTTLLTLAVLALLAASLSLPPVRKLARAAVPTVWLVHLNGYRLGYTADYGVRIPMPDGITLAATLYLPRHRADRLGTVLVMSPYGRLRYGEGLRAAEFFASHGYAVLVQDLRGKHDSQGEFMPYRSGTRDGAATLDWITAQSWSNGKVGTFGCSALGESQFVLARARHPAHVAMIPMGAGGAVGSALGRYAYFGLFEGGIFQLASGFGWFMENGATDRRAVAPAPIDLAGALRALPLRDLVKRIDPAPNSFEWFVTTPLNDPRWNELDYLAGGELPSVPALVVNTWGDQTVGDTLALAEAVRRSGNGNDRQRVVIAPGTHCHHEETGADGRFGDLAVNGADQPYLDWYLRWFDHWLNGKGPGLTDMPDYLVYVLGEHRWLNAQSWPPQEAETQRWYLDSDGGSDRAQDVAEHANGANGAIGTKGSGRLRRDAPAIGGVDRYAYDPQDPVPSRGGPLCCTGNKADRAGPIDQRDVEAREDVLVYTSAMLESPLRIVGPLRAELWISSSAPDTDFVARLVDVWPDGRATGIQEGALRARYREGIDRPAPLVPLRPTRLSIDMRSIAYFLPKGHRLRLHVTSSSFPRLERNLNTGGRNYDETIGVVARNAVHHGGDLASFVELPVVP